MDKLSFSAWFFELLSNQSFLLPLYSTTSAALILMLLQFLYRWVSEKRQKIYTANLILDVSFRAQFSSLTLLRHTIEPHIDAAIRILKGDEKLLDDVFLTDEFDILRSPPFPHPRLSEESRVLLGYDDFELVQLFEVLLYLESADENRTDLVSFVRDNLKDANRFGNLSSNEQEAILHTYWDYLSSIKTELLRVVHYVDSMIVPKMRSYLSEKQFWFFNKGSAYSSLHKLEHLKDEYAELFPDDDFLEQRKLAGVQSMLKDQDTESHITCG